MCISRRMWSACSVGWTASCASTSAVWPSCRHRWAMQRRNQWWLVVVAVHAINEYGLDKREMGGSCFVDSGHWQTDAVLAGRRSISLVATSCVRALMSCGEGGRGVGFSALGHFAAIVYTHPGSHESDSKYCRSYLIAIWLRLSEKSRRPYEHKWRSSRQPPGWHRWVAGSFYIDEVGCLNFFVDVVLHRVCVTVSTHFTSCHRHLSLLLLDILSFAEVRPCADTTVLQPRPWRRWRPENTDGRAAGAMAAHLGLHLGYTSNQPNAAKYLII